MKKLLLSFIAVIAAIAANAQSELKVFPDWSSTTGSQNFFYKNVTKTDASNNVYIAGATTNGNGDYDILVAKYNVNGVQQWIRQYNGAGNGNDMAAGLYIDGSGNVYITGTVTTATNIDVITIKYNSSGTQQWLSTYDGTGSGIDCGADVTVDASSNVYVTGSSMNASGNYDVITIKYNSSGVQQWATSYDNPTHLNDAGAKIALDRFGNVITTVLVQYTSTTYKCGVITYNVNTGALMGGTLSGISTSYIDQVADMVLDASGNIYIAGSAPVSGQGHNYDIIKLSSSLVKQWEVTYDGGSNLDDIAKGIQVDASGNVYVTGYSTSSTQGKNIATIKYNSSGTQQWVQTYNDNLNGDDEANAMAIDASGNIYVTGYTSTEIDKADYFTAKYNASGSMLWSIHNDTPSHLNDIATNIAIDNNGDIVISGPSETDSSVYTYYTVKYVERQIITPADYNSEEPNSSFLYYRNGGQLVDTEDTLVPEIKFYTNNSSPAFYFKKNSSSFVFAHIDTSASTNDTLHRIDLTYEKVNNEGKTYAMEEQSSYLNYYLGHCPKGVTEVHGNQRLITSNLYANIDLMYSSNQDGIKYYYIIKPGGNPAGIQMLFTGATSFNLDGTTNALTINSPIGSITYERPTAYQLSSANVVIPITGWQCAWQTNGATNKYKFYTSTYDNSKALIIQVDLGHQTLPQTSNCDWSTYYGGSGTENGNDIISDASGNIFYTGETNSPSFPHVTGGVYTTHTGDDAFLLKFNSSGVPQWGTYYSGTGGCLANGVALNSSGEVYIVGTTTSSNIPLVPAGNSSLQGSEDAFIAKFNSLGNTLLFARYFGGNNNDLGRSIAIDGNNNVYIVGTTYSNSGFPTHTKAGTGVYNQATTSATTSYSDAFIVEFNSTNDASTNQLWGSYFGGSGSDDFSTVKIGANNSVFVSGSTLSTVAASSYGGNPPCGVPNSNTYFPDCNPGGVYYHGYAGTGVDNDAIIVEFDQNSLLQWSTYFGGEGNEESAIIKNSITFDPNNLNILYLVGKTSKLTGFPTVGGGTDYLQTTNFSSERAFIAKFNSRVLEWATVFGAGPNTFGWDATVDKYHNLYIVGHTQAQSYASNTCAVPTNQLTDFPKCAATGMYNQVNYGGGSSGDGFISAFNSRNELVWSTYYGGNTTDEVHSIGYDNSSNRVYITGITQSTSGFPLLDPQTGNPEYSTNSGGTNNRDSYIARFCVDPLLGAGIFENTKIKNFRIFPNPTSESLNIDFYSENDGTIKIQFFNDIGVMIKEQEETVHIYENMYNFNVSGFPTGLYFVQIVSTKNKYSAKVIIK